MRLDGHLAFALRADAIRASTCPGPSSFSCPASGQAHLPQPLLIPGFAPHRLGGFAAARALWRWDICKCRSERSSARAGVELLRDAPWPEHVVHSSYKSSRVLPFDEWTQSYFFRTKVSPLSTDRVGWPEQAILRRKKDTDPY